jgi:predicted metalloprotease with PDZ domain
MSNREARLAHFSLGSFRHEQLLFGTGRDNVLGIRYLSRYRITIDFPNKRLYLAKGKHFADRDKGHTCGLLYWFRSGRLAVDAVDEKGPAYAAGARAKDIIVMLGGKPVSEWKASQVERLLTTEGKAVQITVERGGKQMEMSFTPKEYD